MKDKTRVLVVGLGSIGQRHARLLSERDDVELHLCDPVVEYRSQTLAALKSPSKAEYSEFSIALKAHPDIVFVCVPNHLHAPIGLQAIENGVDVFIEKPMSDSLETARKLLIAAESAGRFLQIGYMMRLDDGLCKLKDIVDSGDLGNLIGGRAMIGTYITLLNAKNSDRIERPNSLIIDYTHEIDFIRWFFGEVGEVTAMGARLGDIELKPYPNIFQMILKMDGGALVQIHMDYVQYPQRRIFEIYGDKGTLSYDFMTGEIRYFHSQREHLWEDLSVQPIMERWDDLFRKEHEAIFNARANGASPLVTGRDGLQALEVAERAIAKAI
ncbi:MAG: Gfo/Idh/MocA family oxidoreductase [Chitinophagaceae bacterium]|nr:Gfo/Idh/MocA family oxidoreductase [Chitinophagaceae bacterium]